MKTSGRLKWPSNGKLGFGSKNNGSTGNKWIHPQSALQDGHIAYLVKFLGSTEVDKAKGIDVVKDGIRKISFNQQLKKSEGAKPPKVELTVSINGVTIQEPKSKVRCTPLISGKSSTLNKKKILHQYPLHRISYCADDKGEKRFLSFIAKEADSDKHTCFVFISDKLAEEITLTIGQAFELAYRKFLENSTDVTELRRLLSNLQRQLQETEERNNSLQLRLDQVSSLIPKESLKSYLQSQGVSPIISSLDYYSFQISSLSELPKQSLNYTSATLLPLPSHCHETLETNDSNSPKVACVGRKLEGLLLEDFKNDFNPAAVVNGVEEKQKKKASQGDFSLSSDLLLLDATPVKPLDPFGMSDFTTQEELESAIGLLDTRISEIRVYCQ